MQFATALVVQIWFQSTPSGGKATLRVVCGRDEALFQSTPSGGKATGAPGYNAMGQAMFQSTPSGGKATLHPDKVPLRVKVSIHAFRGEGDQRWGVRQQNNRGFNPRLPGGRRRNCASHSINSRPFQSTPSGGKATKRCGTEYEGQRFQSTPSGGKATPYPYQQ